MRVLLDENLPQRLRHLFAPSVQVATVGYLGWKGTRNGKLLRAAEAEDFDVLITMDQGIPHEQNLRELRIAILLLEAQGNRFEDLEPLMKSVNERLERLQPGELARVGY